MARAKFVNKARKDIPQAGIKAGESYYWWKFRYGGKHYSKTRPRPSQLTQSDFYSRIYEIQEEIADAEASEEIEELAGDWASRLREIAEECEEKIQNLPESLQYAPTGELLQERADACNSAADELEGIDFEFYGYERVEFDEDEVEREGFESDDEYQAAVDEAREQHEIDEDQNAIDAENEHWESKLEEVQNVIIDAP